MTPNLFNFKIHKTIFIIIKYFWGCFIIIFEQIKSQKSIYLYLLSWKQTQKDVGCMKEKTLFIRKINKCLKKWKSKPSSFYLRAAPRFLGAYSGFVIFVYCMLEFVCLFNIFDLIL